MLSAPRVAVTPPAEPAPTQAATPPGFATANAARLSPGDAPPDCSAKSIGTTRPTPVTTASSTGKRSSPATPRQLDTDRPVDKRQRPHAAASRTPPTDRLAERDTGRTPELTGPAPRTGLESAQASAFRGTRERLAGYLDVLTAAGITEVTVSEAPWLAASTARASATELLTAEPRPTAVLCMSDQLAFAAIAAARRLGLRVPEDVSIVGFDDTPQASWSDPPLTTVRQDLAGKGRIAGELVLRLLDGDPAPPPIELPVSLIIRESTATI
ncbi:substrate-binding domain-containing protein [Amycolatopsis panacis]|uniref:substrate-binding domain-containing protein n=1 Tax=Amycolatopsis panacis TaxID=2340917 RepID=UPI0038992697